MTIRALIASFLILAAVPCLAETEIAGLWSAGWPKDNGKVKNFDELEPLVDVWRVAVSVDDLAQPNPPMAFTSSRWRLADHLEATGSAPHWLVVLFEPPGDDGGANFKRGPPSLVPFSVLAARVSPWLASGRFEVLELGNEFGVVASGADLARRQSYLLDLAEAVAPWLAREYPGVTLAIGGLAGPSDARGLISYFLANGSDYLRTNSVLDYHPQELSPSFAASEIDAIRARGWEPVVGEFFSGSPMPNGKTRTSFAGSLAMARVAHAKGLRYTAAFTAFFERAWGHNKHADTEFLGVTGPRGNWRSGRFGEPDHVEELRQMAAIEPGDVVDCPTETWAVRLLALRAVALRVEDRGYFADWREAGSDCTARPSTCHHDGPFPTPEAAVRHLEAVAQRP